jgi:hypothetical protein
MSTNKTGSLELFAASPSHIELIPATQHPRFRLSAVYRTHRSTDPDSWAGLYVASVGSASGTGRSLIVRFRDNCNPRPQFPNGDPLLVDDRLHFVLPGQPLATTTSTLVTARIQEPLDEKTGFKTTGLWRRLVVEMRADGLHVQFSPNADANPPIAVQLEPVPLAKLQRLTQVRRDRLAKDYPQQAGAPVEFNPAGGCGLYVHHASITLRNVEFEPLP